jgi:hypothetical protein
VRRIEKGLFLGYDTNSTGYRVFIVATFKVIVSDEVIFEEDDDGHKPQNLAILQEFPFAKEKTITDEADNHSPSTQKTVPMPKVPPFESLSNLQSNSKLSFQSNSKLNLQSS